MFTVTAMILFLHCRINHMKNFIFSKVGLLLKIKNRENENLLLNNSGTSQSKGVV